MFHRKTVFVVGAGASAEANLPIGTGLAHQISQLLRIPQDWATIGERHRVFANALGRYCIERGDLNQHVDLSHQIASGLQAVASIDKYIDTHRHDDRIGQIAKAAIVHTILQAERDSKFWETQLSPTVCNPLPHTANTWYFPFARMIVDDVPKGRLDDLFTNLTIISFNYDRCIEEFLAHWLTVVYAIDLTIAREITSRLNTIRPYGQVGPIDRISFGDVSSQHDSFLLNQNINTFTEQISDHSITSAIKSAVASADTIVFLGSGFHQQNLDILKPNIPTRVSRILASGRGLKPPNAATVAKELQQLFGIPGSPNSLSVTVDFNSGCTTLFEKYSRSMNPIA